MELLSTRKRKRKMESSTDDDEEPELTTVCNLDDFPEHLLLHIISFLPTIDAINASSISRRWRNLWFSIPSLNFSLDDFPPSSSPSATSRRFAAAINQALSLRSPQAPPLHTFRLLFNFKSKHHYSLIKSWVLYAINHQVTELDVDFFPCRRFRADYLTGTEHPMFDFPFSALRKSRVRVLKISRCYLHWPAKISRLKFDSIRSIYLDQSYLEDSMVFDLLNGCSNLESLSLRYVWGMENAKYFGSKLKTLSLRNFNGVQGLSSVEIDCPNLVYLEMDSYVVEKYTLNYSPAVVEASVYFWHREEYCGAWSKVVRLLGHVEKLTVQNWWYKLLEQNDFFPAGFKFYNLRWLELKTEYTKSELHGIAVLLELSPNLETLILDYLHKINKVDDDDDDDNDGDGDGDDNGNDNDNDDAYDDVDVDVDVDEDDNDYDDDDESLSDELLNKPINLSLPRLRQVKMKAFASTKKEYLLLDLFKKQGVVCQKIEVTYFQNCDGSIDPPEVWARNPNGAEVQGSSPHWEIISSN